MENIIQAVLGEAAKSNVEKRKVGCVIVKDSVIISKGYNTPEEHAEVNAISKASASMLKGATAHISHAPCPECAEIMTNHGLAGYEVVEEFIKFDGDKLRPDLIPASSLSALAEVLTFGARKYKPNNWKKCKDKSRYEAAFMRHYIAYKSGEALDPESKMPHLWHMFTNIAFLIELENTDA